MSTGTNPVDQLRRKRLWEAEEFLRVNPKVRAEIVASEFPTETWPEPTQFGNELPAVPMFDHDLLPSSFRPLAEEVSELMQTPVDYAAAASVVSLAGCVNRRARIQPKAQDNTWIVVPNLWGAIIGPPGFMKSPVLRKVTHPLTRIENEWREQYKKELSEFKRKQKLAGTEEELEEPTQRRLLLADATFEKLHEILSENPEGVFVLRDELTGWLAQLEKRGRECERAFHLEAWNGDGGFTVDRIGRGSIHVPAVCVSLLGNIQPARLRWYLSEVLAGGPSDDGLLQRFQIMVWPDLPQNWELVDRQPNSKAFDAAERVYMRLIALSEANPLLIRFDAEAQDLFFKWWNELEQKIRGDACFVPVMVAHLAKYRSLMPTLAGLFELADRASEGRALEGRISISLAHARQAAAFCDFLEAHALRVYSCIKSPESKASRELAQHIQKRDLPPAFTTRDVYLKGWTGLDRPEAAQGALSALEEAGWLRRVESAPTPRGGRPSEIWVVNPKVSFHAQ